MRILMLLALSCGLFARDGWAQVATVRGVVVDDSGAALPGATIVLASDDANPRETVSDLKGSFGFARVALGNTESASSSPASSRKISTWSLAPRNRLR